MKNLRAQMVAANGGRDPEAKELLNKIQVCPPHDVY